ncbi:jg11976, partial [Pararge aegeria aegeria]
MIYCHGPLLHTVQMAGLYNDSKTFVDKKMRSPASVILDNFQTMMNRTDFRPTKEEIRTFVDNNFDVEGSEFEEWQPLDWKHNPGRVLFSYHCT